MSTADFQTMLEKAIQDTLFEQKIQEIQQTMKKDDAVLQVVESTRLEEKHKYLGESKHKNIPYSLVSRRLEEHFKN